MDLKSEEVGYDERIGSGGTDSILSDFFRIILKDKKIDSLLFQALTTKYVVSSGMATNSQQISSSRSAVRRELMAPTMTWKVFNKSMMFLQVEEFELTISLYRDGVEKVSNHSHTFIVTEELARDEDATTNSLAQFLWEILEELEIDDQLFNQFLSDYSDRARPGGSLSDRHTTKHSLKREILRDAISWKVLVKALLFLKTWRFGLNIKVIHEPNILKERKVSFHRRNVSFR